jgi:charged multivesicular body protein 7
MFSPVRYIFVNHDNILYSHQKRARLPALYADFGPQRHSNPDGYAANVRAWREAIEHAARQGSLRRNDDSHALVICVDSQLLADLEHRCYGQPLALDAVVLESVREEQLIPLQSFISRPDSIYSTSWTDFPWNAMTWALQRMGLGATPSSMTMPVGGRYVSISNTKAASNVVLQQLTSSSSPFDTTYTRWHFEQVFRSVTFPGRDLTALDFDVLLKFMQRDLKAINYNGSIIKLSGAGQSESNRVLPEDATIANLRELMTSLDQQIEQLSFKIQDLNNFAKISVSRGNMISARAALKSRKLSEGVLESRHAMLNELEQVAAKIQQASDQVQLVQVLDGSSDLLRGLNKACDPSNIEDLVAQLHQGMTKADEIELALTSDRIATVVGDDNAVSNEENSMLRQLQNDMEESKITDLERRLDALSTKPHELPSVVRDFLCGTPSKTELVVAGSGAPAGSTNVHASFANLVSE